MYKDQIYEGMEYILYSCERTGLENLEPTRHQSLEDTSRVILLRNRLQLAVVLRSVSREDLLEASSVTPIHY